MTNRLPGPVCVMSCGKPLDETGGVRLIWAGSFGVTLRTIQSKLGEFHHPARTIRLEGDHRDVVIVFFGKWKEDSIERAREVTQEGHRPWFCQRCVWKALCPKCGEPMRPVGGADTLGDDGKIRHAPNFSGIGQRCRDSDCVGFTGEG